MTTRQRILTIEDDPAIRRGIVDALRFAGYEPLEAGRGQQGLKMALAAGVRSLALGPRAAGVRRHVHPPRGPQGAADAAGHHPHGPRRRRRSHPRTGRRGGRLRRQALQRQGAAWPAWRRCSAAARSGPATCAEFALPSGVVDLERREVRFADGRRTELSEREAELFRYLAINSGRAISRDETPGQRLADQSPGASHADDRHAHRPAARKARRRLGRAAGALDGPRSRIHGGGERFRLARQTMTE